MKKILLITSFLIALAFSCKAQQNNHTTLIHDFFKEINSSASFGDLYKQNILYTFEAYNKMKNKTEVDSIYTTIIRSIKEQVSKCNSKPLEILTVDESFAKKKYKENLNIPSDYDCNAYIVFCDSTVVTRFLIRENRIASFSVIDKGGQSFFLLF